MRSKASIKSHPIHPILVSFPVAFLTGAYLCDIIAYLREEIFFSQFASYLCIAGIISGLLAAVFGIIDYVYTVPPQSSAKKRGAKHGLLNVVQLTLFFIAWLMRENDGSAGTWVMVLQTAALIIIFIAGWMGGTLVYRNQIGVDPRYANAGKWKEEHITPGTGKLKIAIANELELNQMKLLHIGEKRIVLARSENGFVAFDDRCPHRGGSLAGGSMICGTVQCPWHGSQFKVQDGSCVAGPAKSGIEVYEVSEIAGTVFIHWNRHS